MGGGGKGVGGAAAGRSAHGECVRAYGNRCLPVGLFPRPATPLARPPTVSEAVGAEEAAVLVVATLVEEPADLVHPALALVALHPALLHLQRGGGGRGRAGQGGWSACGGGGGRRRPQATAAPKTALLQEGMDWAPSAHTQPRSFSSQSTVHLRRAHTHPPHRHPLPHTAQPPPRHSADAPRRRSCASPARPCAPSSPPAASGQT